MGINCDLKNVSSFCLFLDLILTFLNLVFAPKEQSQVYLFTAETFFEKLCDEVTIWLQPMASLFIRLPGFASKELNAYWSHYPYNVSFISINRIFAY